MALRRRGGGAGQAPFPFVVGMNRSGTTLLRMMLDAHPELTIPPETHFVPDLIDACREDAATPESALAAMKAHREWEDFGFTDEQDEIRSLAKRILEAHGSELQLESALEKGSTFSFTLG